MTGREHVEVFRGGNGDWWWRHRGANGRIVAASGEGFTRRWSARRAARRAAPGVPLMVESKR